MRFRLYQNPKEVGWLGWIEGENERCIGFVHLDGLVQFGY